MTIPASEAHEHTSPASDTGTAPTGVPVDSELHTVCSNPSVDGDTAGLQSVELVAQGDQLVLAFTFTDSINEDLNVRVVAVAGGTDSVSGDADGFSVTAALSGGVPAAVTLQTPTSLETAPRPQDLVHVAQNQVHIGVPSSLLDSLGPEWHWNATSASSAARGQCPASSPSEEFPSIPVGG